MPSVSWGGGVNSTSMYTSDLPFIYSDATLTMPTTDLAANGNRPIRVNSITINYVENGSPHIDYQGVRSAAPRTYATSGGSFYIFAYRTGGTLRVGRETGGAGRTYWSDGNSLSGIMPGSVSYAGVASAPRSASASPSSNASGAVTITWTSPANDGGAAVSGYNVYENGTLIATLGNTGTYTRTGLTPGTTYNYTIRARNQVSDDAGTQSVNSNTATVVAPGVPTAPTGLSATPSTTQTGRVALSWSAPATPGTGGITGYNIFRDGVQIATTTGTGLTYTATGLTPYTSYGFSVKARNAFADANNSVSAASSTSNAVAPGPPSAPSGLAAVADGLTPGKIDLTWDAPTSTGTGGITGYNVYLSTGELLATLTGAGRTYSTSGLNPGQTYTFYVTARNALADSEGSQSASSNTATAQALGEPPAPTGLTATASSAVPGRITLSWTPPGGSNTGFNVFERNTSTSVDTLIATVKTSGIKLDGLTAGALKTYVVRTRNSYTDTLSDGYPGNHGGPASTSASATPVSNYTVSVANLTGALTNNTNVQFNGTFVIASVTPTTIKYSKTAPDVVSVAMTSGTVTDTTNQTFNGTYTISTPTPSTFTYAKTAANIASRAVTGGTIANNTNVTFNGTYTVTAVNVGARTVSYARSGAAVTSVAVPVNALPGASSQIQNLTNAVYNGSALTITATSPYTISYSKTNANLTESNAAGTATNTTNRDFYNGVRAITSIPAYNTFTFAMPATGSSHNRVVPTTPSGQTQRQTSPADLDIKYRSGWAG